MFLDLSDILIVAMYFGSFAAEDIKPFFVVVFYLFNWNYKPLCFSAVYMDASWYRRLPTGTSCSPSRQSAVQETTGPPPHMSRQLSSSASS